MNISASKKYQHKFIYEPIDRWSAPRDPAKCSAIVYNRGLDVRGHQCPYSVKTTVNGYGWCTRHEPKEIT